MAAPNLTSGERLNVYHRLFLLNRSFHFITRHLEEPSQAGIFGSRDIKEMLGLAQEVQTEINMYCSPPSVRLRRTIGGTSAKVRIAMEKRLKSLR